MLFSNPEISAFIRKNFVAAWESVRPVPVVSIDFGNGKTLDGDIISPLAKVALIRRLAVKELLSRNAIVESFEQLVNKLASSGDTNAHSFALELLWQRMPALRKEEPEHIPPVLFTILTTVRDRKVTAAVKEILKTYPDDVVRKALAARLDM